MPSLYTNSFDILTPTSRRGDTGRRLMLKETVDGTWRPRNHQVTWIEGPQGSDGYALDTDRDALGRSFTLRATHVIPTALKPTVPLGTDLELANPNEPLPNHVQPSPDLQSVLLGTDLGECSIQYSVLDVHSQTIRALDPQRPDVGVQCAIWSPRSGHIAFVRDHNVYLGSAATHDVVPITADGTEALLYGVPCRLYREEIFYDQSQDGMWWSADGRYLAFLRTDESMVPLYPVQYFVARPSSQTPGSGLGTYPEVRNIRYPRPGAPIPVVGLQFYDVDRSEAFSVSVPGDFASDDRLLVQVVWLSGSQLLVRETNRVSDVLRVLLIDAATRSGRVLREDDLRPLGGWIEPVQSMRPVPPDPERGRLEGGYLDLVIHNHRTHIAYYRLSHPEDPVILTTGDWDVTGVCGVDLQLNRVYFAATKHDPGQRHIYSVQLDGTNFKSITDLSIPGYYEASFSTGAQYALLTYVGPDVPYQKLLQMEAATTKEIKVLEPNAHLTDMVRTSALPEILHQTVTVNGHQLPVMEYRPPTFDDRKKYPVLFHVYGGPQSQTVDRKFHVNYHSYLASTRGYVVVIVDGRGTGYMGAPATWSVGGQLGHYEAMDQIATAKLWAAKPYVDACRMAIWGWSYGGFVALKVLEQDAGRTFQYGIAVAPVTDWRFYGTEPAYKPHGFVADNGRMCIHGAVHEAPDPEP